MCFVKYFELFADRAVSDDKIADELTSREPSFKSWNANLRRAKAAREIIREGAAKPAMRYAAQSSRLASEFRQKAAGLVESLP
jgi:hypothetical protein